MVVKMSKQKFKAYVQSIVNTCDTTALLMVHNGLSSESTSYEPEGQNIVKVAFADKAGEYEEYKLFNKTYKGE